MVRSPCIVLATRTAASLARLHATLAVNIHVTVARCSKHIRLNMEVDVQSPSAVHQTSVRRGAQSTPRPAVPNKLHLSALTPRVEGVQTGQVCPCGRRPPRWPGGAVFHIGSLGTQCIFGTGTWDNRKWSQKHG